MIRLAAVSVRPLVLAVASLALGACTLGPDYRRPDVPMAEAYRAADGWKPATPADALARGAWWSLYGDAELDALVARLNASNQSLAAAEAQFRQALAVARGTRAQLFPLVTADGGFSRARQGSAAIGEQYDLGLSASWELDLWGRLRRSLEADRALVSASAADHAAVRLSLQSQLVQSYLQLRVLDVQARLLEETLAAYQRSLNLTRNQYEAGIVPKSDVTQAQAQFKNAEADLIDLRWQRAQLENAIAVLVGVPPSELAIARDDRLPALPEIPVGLPSTLLERRPDVAAAERQVMAANAEIGVAEAAWFPTLSLGLGGGYTGSRFGDLISTPNRYWSLGPQMALTLLDFGSRRAQERLAAANYDQVVATYRETVLQGLREVEDYLVQLRVLAEEAAVQQEALAAARESLQLMENQYRAGVVDYLDVATLQTNALNSERTALGLHGSRLTASVLLIAALGGGWDDEPPASAEPR